MSTQRTKLWILKGAMAASVVAIMGVTAGCASTPGTRPHDMSAAGHEQMAAQEDTAAAEHKAQYDPNAPPNCVRDPKGKDRGTICWGSRANPTQEHLKMANDAKARAAEHRAASQALRDAETRSCVGIAEDDRDMSPFAHREDITDVTPVNTKQARGAIVTFRPVYGLTVEWLQQEIDCHLARNAAMGFDSKDMPFCPLALKDVTAKVSSTGNGFAIQILSTDTDTGVEIQRRAQALRGP